MKRNPDKITPDNLKDTVIEYRFLSDVPYEILPGLIYQELREEFTVIPRPSTVGILQINPQESIRIANDGSVQLVNDHVKIQLSDGLLVFNSLDKYPGWDVFFKCIGNVLQKLFEGGLLKAIVRIGIRYISEYPGMSIFEVMKEQPVLTLPQGEGQNVTYRTEVRKQDYTIVLNLADKVTRQGAPSSETFFSLIDIDVFKVFQPPMPNVQDVLDLTDTLHTIEKDVFFGLLTAEYIKTLNPEYKK